MKESAVLFAFLAAMVWGIAPLAEKAGLSYQMDPLVGVAVRSLAITVVAAVLVIASGRLPLLAQLQPQGVGLVMVGGLLAGLLAQWLYYTALQRGEVSRVVPISAVYPMIALLLGVLLMSEALTWQKGVGCLLVVGGLALLR